MGLFWSDSPKDWDKEIEKTTYCYCLKCGERLKSHSFWYCPNPSLFKTWTIYCFSQECTRIFKEGEKVNG